MIAIRPGCIFCELVHGGAEVSLCYEDRESMAFMDIQPVNIGHLLVVPRAHYESLDDIPAALAVHLFEVALRLAPIAKRISACDGLNIVVNSGESAGQNVHHYHVHVIPRRAGDGFEIALPFPNSTVPDRSALDAAAARIIAALRDPARATAVSSASREGGR